MAKANQTPGQISNMKVGDKVVCIDDSDSTGAQKQIADYWIKEGEIYCIRGLDLRFLPLIGLRLVGMDMRCGGLFDWDNEPSWDSRRFRKIVTESERIAEEKYQKSICPIFITNHE